MLASLDLTTLTVTLTLVTLSMTLLLALAAWHAGTEQGLRHWALGNCALMLGLLLNVNQQHLHHSLSIILANGLMTLDSASSGLACGHSKAAVSHSGDPFWLPQRSCCCFGFSAFKLIGWIFAMP